MNALELVFESTQSYSLLLSILAVGRQGRNRAAIGSMHIRMEHGDKAAVTQAAFFAELARNLGGHHHPRHAARRVLAGDRLGELDAARKIEQDMRFAYALWPRFARFMQSSQPLTPTFKGPPETSWTEPPISSPTPVRRSPTPRKDCSPPCGLMI